MDTYNIANVVIAIAGILITAFIIPYLKQKKTNEEWKQIIDNVNIAVNAAEQIFWHGDNRTKFNYADEVLQNLFPNKLTEEQRKMLIESSVQELKNLEKKLLK